MVLKPQTPKGITKLFLCLFYLLLLQNSLESFVIAFTAL